MADVIARTGAARWRLPLGVDGRRDSRATPAPGTLSLLTTSVSVSEGGQFTITLRRAGGSDGAVAVDWAVAGATTTPQNGTVNWAAADSTDKSVQITAGLVADTIAAAINLSNARRTDGGQTQPVLGTSSGTVTVVNSPDPTSWNLPATLNVQQSGSIGLRQYAVNATGYTISVSGLPAGVTYNAGTESLEGASTGTGSATATFTLTLGGTTVVDTATVSLVDASSTLVHGELYTIMGSGFGTRADYNAGDYTWNGHRYLHWLWADFDQALPAADSSDATYFSALRGMTLHPSNRNQVARVSGGPSQSGYYIRRGVATGFAQPGGLVATTGNSSPFPTSPSGYISFKHRGSGDGKIFRWWRNGIQENWYMGGAGLYRENEWPLGGVAWFGVGFARDFTTFRRYSFLLDEGGSSRLWCNGDVVTASGQTAWPLVNSGDSHRDVEVTWPNSLDTGGEYHYADIYYDFTAARVEISVGGVAEIQILTSWVDSSISYVFNKGSLPAGDGNLYVYAADNSLLHTESVVVA